jgi:hypothetical protein
VTPGGERSIAPAPPGERLADAVAADTEEAFGRFVAARASDSLVALALCSVDDAVPPYIMGATLADVGPISGTKRTWGANPADWSWNDAGHRYRCSRIIGEILDAESRPFEARAKEIFEGMVDGLKKFDASGKFQGKLPRDQMLLVLWINDPSEQNARSVMKWVEQMNPKPVSKWFSAVYPYRP